jgi:simple sugar transport system substrate-binding protein
MRWIRVLVVIALLVALAPVGSAQTKLKACFLYVGPIGDYGWTHAHDQGRLAVERALPEVETAYVENVPDAQTEPFIDKLVSQGCKVIFTTSFGYMDGTLASAKRYPNVIFAHATGFKRAPNMATYQAEFYQVYYLNGLVAGALTKTGRVGYLAAFPIPEVKRHISAFALGVREVNPKATVHVRWIFDWFHPAKAKEATEALRAEGVDVGTQTEDSPTFVQVMASKGLPSFSHYSPMYKFAPGYVVSGQLVHWDRVYIDFLRKVLAGKYTSSNLVNVDIWWRLKEGAVEMGAQAGMPINPAWVARLKAARAVIGGAAGGGRASVYDLVMDRLAQMSTLDPKTGQPLFDPFSGPLRDRRGILRIPAGQRATYQQLMTMEWAALGIVGPWENEPK